MTIVLGHGRTPNPVLLCGEAPGKEEAYKGRPFVGKSGEEQEWYLSRYNLSASRWYMTNVVKEYLPGNPDPTPELIESWTPVLLDELEECQPRLIIAVGRHAARWFLGDSATMEACHGLAHKAGAFDQSRRNRGGPRDAVILPIYHPARGLYDNDMKALINWDYSQVALILDKINRNQHKDIDYRVDQYTGRENYRDVTGVEFARYLDALPNNCVLGLDTEGTTTNPATSIPWSIQISDSPGKGLVLRTSQKDFALGASALQRSVNRGARIAIHNAMYDIEMCRKMGIDLFSADIYDTMYAAYLLRLEPQGLKPLAWRWCGMKMREYEEVVGQVGLDLQIDFLSMIMSIDWPEIEPRVILNNDGTSKLYRPKGISASAEKILLDIAEDSRDKDGNPTNPFKRWQKVLDKYDRETIRYIVERVGDIPIGTLDDIPLEEAIIYSARDADAALRVYDRMRHEVRNRELGRLMREGMEVLPIFEEIQCNGFPASRRYFQELYDRLTEEIHSIGAGISHKYYQGKPFNPRSDDQVRSLLRRQGLTGNKRTKTGKVSTGKQSIEYLRYENEAMKEVFEWRERQHVRDNFCVPVLDRIPPEIDVMPIRCNVKITRTATRRPATTEPNLLGIPTRTETGKLVRLGYVAPEGYELVSCDESQIELRCLADASGDEILTQVFLEDRDPHAETASRMFKVELDKVDKMKQRYPAKTTGFGIVYGMGPPALLTQFQMVGLLDYDKKDCEKFIRNYLTVHEGVAEYIRRVKAEARKTGVVYDDWGMPRYIPGIWSEDREIYEEAGRIAVSHKIQGKAQGMIQRSMAWLKPQIRSLQKSGVDVRWLLEMHDELILLVEEGLGEVVKELVIEALEEHYDYGCDMSISIPIKASGSVGKSWGELK